MPDGKPRSKQQRGDVAEWLGTALQKLQHRFDSGRRLDENIGALSSGEERFLDAEEVTGSNPVAPTYTRRRFVFGVRFA